MMIINNKLQALLVVLLISISSLGKTYHPKVIVHRGGGGECPENTIIAFESSLKAGADGIELDIQLSKDGVIMVYHSQDLSTITEAKGKVSDFTAI